MKKAICILILILLIALLAVGFLFIYKVSNGFTTDITRFFLSMNRRLITRDIDGASIFDVPIKAYTLFGKQDLEVRIIPNDNLANFKFKADGIEKRFSDETDYTEGFNITTKSNVITVEQTDMEEVLKKKYSAERIEILGVNKANEYFVLVISDKNSGGSYRIKFLTECKGKVLPQSVSLNTPKITF